MNDNNIDTAPEVMDSGWLRFWITFSSVCLVLSIFMPDVHMLKNRYLLTWFWESKAINSPGFHGIVWVYVLLSMSFLLFVFRSVFAGKYLAVLSVFSLILTSFVLLTTGTAPKNPGIWSNLSPLWVVLFLVSTGFILSGTHLQKVFQNRHFASVMLAVGGLVLLSLLFVSPSISQQGLFLSLISTAAWKGQPLVTSISVILILLVSLVAIVSIKLNTRRGLSIFLRLVFLGIPVLVFFYLYLSASTSVVSIATVSFEATQQTLWIYGFLMLPAAVASLIEWNTLFD